MSPSKSSALDPAEWPVVPQTTNGELSHRTDSDESSDLARGRIVCVLGMHGSGTSVAARLMNLLGIDLGAEEHLLGPLPQNPKGFWEYEPIIELNEELLGRLGGKWDEPPPSPPGWETAAEFADLRQRARDLVERTFTSRDWGWKDPRTCLTLPFWKAILPPLHYVICMRSPADVAASLEVRNGFSMEKSTRLWQAYTGAAIEQTAGLPRHFLFYEDLIRSHREEVSRLARFLGRQDALDQPAIPAAIEDFLEPDLCRHRTSLINTLDNPNVLFPAKAFYFAVRIAARSGGSCHGLSDIPGRDPVGEQIWPIFSRSSRRAQEDRDEMTRDRAGLESRLGEISAEAQGLRVRLSDLEKQAADREVAHSAIQDRSRELEADNRRLAEEKDRAEYHAGELRAALAEREALCREHARLIAGRDAELAERTVVTQWVEEEREARQAELQSIQARLGELEADNGRLGEERDQTITRACSRLSRLLQRRPTLEIHVPMSPTSSFLYQLRCLTHSLRRFGGAYREAPVIGSVGADRVDQGLAERMPWLAANGIELRWVPEAEFAALGLRAAVAARFKQDFRSDMVLLLDADTLIRRPLDDLVDAAHQHQALCGVIAHTTPLVSGRLEDADWARLFAICGLPAPRLDFEHTGWGYMLNEDRHRFCPAYFNAGVIVAPAALLTAIAPVYCDHLTRLLADMASDFDAQIAIATSICQVGAPVRALPFRFNMANNPHLEALHYKEIDHAVILHLLAEQHFRRVETFASLASLEAFLARTDLRVVSRMAQEVIQAIFPDLAAEESRAIAA